MYLIIGLGNPGEEYKHTRHNIGHEIVAGFAKKHDFGDFAFDKKANALVTQGKLEKEKVVLALPETFMNKSGDAVKKLATRYSLLATRLFVVHDDVDLPVGRMKLSFARNSAGHKGVESVIRALKTNEFYRVRIGIGTVKKTKDAMDVVLKKFTPKEEVEIKKVMKRAWVALACAVTENPQKAMTLYNA
ncbi:aminoacyl-tRNA hydrolase [Candidatus Azambacteria bacterium]|nr:aminoacyl-tRNA hydrolase [Candidatus Azambacteria bacterium]MBI3685302.1 aminoacyl-tRNA hydrolase [Candidatus Azambacteria bacterium]